MERPVVGVTLRESFLDIWIFLSGYVGKPVTDLHFSNVVQTTDATLSQPGAPHHDLHWISTVQLPRLHVVGQ